MVAFLGTMVFLRREKKINIRLAGVVHVLIKKEDHTLVPMILADIYRALTVCQKGKGFFEGSNILLQMWIVEHLYQCPVVARFVPKQNDHITDYEKRMKGYKCPEGVSAWDKCFRSLIADKVTWNLPWFPWRQVIHRSTSRLFLLLMGIRGIQPYVPLRVQRQLGRRQIIPVTKDMIRFMFEVRPEIPLPEGLAQQIWDGCRLMGNETMVVEREDGEVHPGYSEWFKKQPPPPVRPERSVKGSIDQEAAIRVGIEMAMRDHYAADQALRAKLECAKAALTQQQAESDAVNEARVKKARLDMERDYQSTI